MVAALHERQSLSPHACFEHYYAGSGLDRERVIELLEHVAAELRLPVDKLRPEDRFAVELSPGRWNTYDSGHAMLISDLAAMARQRGKVVDTTIETVDDYLRAMVQVY
ncbi:hypothetical protein [Stenotrophomonas rhizophila]|uniref:hypothetical protein n=1 Tax=Stenotrophomonas rhizophila TaxID=216778 RepID=UPI001E4EC5F6|nr:hypothetical protein [Stenotrophomonas rhizophila]MCC7633317.1 hypothetical protein [Stenotrophomonas rhizophila]MCC7662208.1 hypothetical protein [Stenotrophomonas rhizophila]